MERICSSFLKGFQRGSETAVDRGLGYSFAIPGILGIYDGITRKPETENVAIASLGIGVTLATYYLRRLRGYRL